MHTLFRLAAAGTIAVSAIAAPAVAHAGDGSSATRTAESTPTEPVATEPATTDSTPVITTYAGALADFLTCNTDANRLWCRPR